ncbi:MAG: hypothetical protein ACXWR1_19530, partial [Bdellovibrionota bacterium]
GGVGEEGVLKHADDEQQSRQANTAPSEGFRFISLLAFAPRYILYPLPINGELLSRTILPLAPPQRASARDRRRVSPEGK